LNHRLQQVGDYQLGNHLKEGIQMFVLPARGVKKSEALHINKDSLSLSVLMFFTEIFHLLVEQTNAYYQQNVDRQATPSS